MEYVMSAITNWADFSGRARRSEYWYFTAAVIVVSFVIGILAAVIGDTLGAILAGLFGLAIIVPGISVAIRRLHDTGKSGWFLLLGFIPFGGFVLLFFYLQDSAPGSNEWGPNPKGM